MKRGFTLAEVLLTLAIIGIVAALTIPAVITKATRDQYVVALRKAYNTLKAVEREAIREQGEMKYWDWKNDNTDFDRYYKPYFDILKECINYDKGCFALEYYDLNGSPSNEDLNSNIRRRFITPDGIAYSYRTHRNAKRQGEFIVDINGKNGINTFGRDTFVFDLFRLEGIKPSGAYDIDNTILESYEVDANCAMDGISTPTVPAGHYCAAKVLAEGAMNY